MEAANSGWPGYGLRVLGSGCSGVWMSMVLYAQWVLGGVMWCGGA